jgi:hypothetical protein
MKLFGSITELVKIVLRKSGFEVTVEPSTASAATTFQLPAAGGGTKTLVTTDDSQTLSNKTIDSTSSVNVSALPSSIPDTKLDTISTAGKVSNSATTATSSNTASAIVARDASGNFSAGTITASLSGNASTATSATSAANLTGSNLTGDVTNVANATTVDSVGGKTSSEVAASVDDTQDATDVNTPSTIVKRDASGNFSAGTVNAATVAVSTSLTVEDPGAGSNKVTVQAPSGLAGNYTLTLPVDDGTSGQVLSTDGSGTLSWASALSNPMDSEGDMIVGGTAGAPTKLDHPGVDNRIVRSTGASSTGFGQIDAPGFFTTGAAASATDIGIVTTGTQTFAGKKTFDGGAAILGGTSGTLPAAGYIGEVLISKVTTSTNAPATNTKLELTTLTLTPGTWLLSGGITYLRNSSTPSAGNHTVAITTSTTASSIDSSAQLEAGFEVVNTVNTSTARYVYAMAPAVVTVTSNTTYRLNCLALYSAGTPQWRGHIQAVRIA